MDNPLSRTEVTLVQDSDGQPVAMHAGVTLPGLIRGQPCQLALDGDVALHPRFARGLAGTRLVLAAARHHMQRWFTPDVALGYGFPDPAPMRVGLRFLGYEILRDVVVLARRTDVAVAPSSTTIRVAPVGDISEAGDTLFQRACSSAALTSTRKDGAYLQWRYARHPELPYTLLLATETQSGEPVGLAVARSGGWHQDLLMVLECLVPDGNPDVERALLSSLVDLARQERHSHLVHWLAGDDPAFLRWQLMHGFHVRSTPWQQCYNCRQAGWDRRALNAQWRQSFGDMDFF